MDRRPRLPSWSEGAQAASPEAATDARERSAVGAAGGGVVAAGGAGWRPYSLVTFVGAPLAMLVLGVVAAVAVAGGYPRRERPAKAAEAVLWRLLQRVVFVNCPRALVVALPLFAFTFKLSVQQQARMAGVVAAGWTVHYVLVSIYLPGDGSPAAQGARSCAWALIAPLNLLPVWLVRGKEKRGVASPNRPVMPSVYVALVCLLASVSIAATTLAGLGDIPIPAWLFVAVVATAVALHKDRPEHTQLSEWYIVALVTVAVSLPLMTSNIVIVLLDNLDQADSLQSLATASALGLFMTMFHAIQYALARRAFAPRFRAVALFPVQVFEDMYAEFFFVESGVYSGGFFVLLALQVARTLGRDTGLFDEASRVTGNVWRRWRDRPTVERAADASLQWARIWLQNMVSEVSAMFLFVGALVAEGAFALEETDGDGDGQMVGQLTGLGREARTALAGGYGVVLAAELCAHVCVFVWLRRLMVQEQARVAAYSQNLRRRSTVVAVVTGTASLSTEAGRLVRNYAVFLLATLLFVEANTLFYIRSPRVSYEK